MKARLQNSGRGPRGRHCCANSEAARVVLDRPGAARTWQHRVGQVQPLPSDKSIVARVEERLLTADGELANARLTRMRARVHWIRLRSYRNLRRRWIETGGDDPVIDRFYRRAWARMNEPLPEPQWQSMWPGMGHNIWEWLQEHYGLALTWGLVHMDDL